MTANANRVLIIDDDTRLTEMLDEYLAPEGLLLTTLANGSTGLREAQTGEYDLIVLDVMLPGLSGFEVLRQLRESGSNTPVLMLTARGDDVDRIVGLEMGADDYLPKPFNPRELLARIKAILRRTNAEFVILATLMRAAGDVVSRETLTRTALGRRLLPDDRSLDTHISNLRKKLGQDTEDGIQIRSVRGSGYVLVPPSAE